MTHEPAITAPSRLPQIGDSCEDHDLSDRQLLERFITVRDESAFTALLQRHGPMVLGVCQRLLPDAHEAEDAFQATFLVLVHKARSIARPELLGPWLYGVASRIAARARQAARRRMRQREEAPMSDSDPTLEVAWRELRELLDEELARLAQKYRVPLVLVYLEGKSTEETARLLGCPKGTVQSRLARGRDKLRHRLVRRGAAVSAVMLGVLLEKAAPAAMPLALAQGTIKAAVLTVAGQATAGAIPTTVAALTKGALRSMFIHKLKVLAVVVLGLTVGIAGSLVGTRAVLADKKEAPKDEKAIVGTWAIESLEKGGQKAPEEEYKDGQLILAADSKLTAKLPKGDHGGTYKLDTSKKPKEITISSDDGATIAGIYKLEGDTLTLCIGDEHNNERPTEFASKEGSKMALVVLKRQKN